MEAVTVRDGDIGLGEPISALHSWSSFPLSLSCFSLSHTHTYTHNGLQETHWRLLVWRRRGKRKMALVVLWAPIKSVLKAAREAGYGVRDGIHQLEENEMEEEGWRKRQCVCVCTGKNSKVNPSSVTPKRPIQIKWGQAKNNKIRSYCGTDRLRGGLISNKGVTGSYRNALV